MAKCPTCGYESTEHGVKLHHSRSHGESYYAQIIRQECNIEPDVWLKQEHHEKGRALSDIGKQLGTDATTVANMCERQGVGTRSYSQARHDVYEEMSVEERRELTKAANEVTRELVEEGKHNFQDAEFDRVLTDTFKEYAKSPPPEELKEWWKENENKRSEFGSKGASGREENGMAGKTGQENPAWRGGKSVYDAIKKQLGKKSWSYLQEHERDTECYNCGVQDEKHDLHHIIPLMCGGTNESWNLMTLCDSCHRKAEHFIRQYPEFEPVLVE